MRMKPLFSKDRYEVYEMHDGYIIHNIRIPWREGHTHLKTLNICRTLIDMALYKKIPRTRSNYILTSLTRISDDDRYREKVQSLIEVRQQKGRKQKCKKKQGFDK